MFKFEISNISSRHMATHIIYRIHARTHAHTPTRAGKHVRTRRTISDTGGDRASLRCQFYTLLLYIEYRVCVCVCVCGARFSNRSSVLQCIVERARRTHAISTYGRT